MSRSGLSILMTSAPRSASTQAAERPGQGQGDSRGRERPKAVPGMDSPPVEIGARRSVVSWVSAVCDPERGVRRDLLRRSGVISRNVGPACDCRHPGGRS